MYLLEPRVLKRMVVKVKLDLDSNCSRDESGTSVRHPVDRRAQISLFKVALEKQNRPVTGHVLCYVLTVYGVVCIKQDRLDLRGSSEVPDIGRGGGGKQ